MSYLAVGATPEAQMKEAIASGADTKEAFTSRCGSYGFSATKQGTAWDDHCIAHEYEKKLGPVFGPDCGIRLFDRCVRPMHLLVGGGIIAAVSLCLMMKR